MTNGKIERFHSTLAEQCRIHETTPEIAVKYLRNEQKRIKFYKFIAFPREDMPKPRRVYSDVKQHHFEIGQLVWKFIPKNSRKKNGTTLSVVRIKSSLTSHPPPST